MVDLYSLENKLYRNPLLTFEDLHSEIEKYYEQFEPVERVNLLEKFFLKNS